MKTKIQGKYLVFEKGDQKCMGALCFEKKEYVEFFIIAAALAMAEELVTKKEISCPEGAWHPCKGGEPRENWGYKAGKQYKDKNCKLLLR